LEDPDFGIVAGATRDGDEKPVQFRVIKRGSGAGGGLEGGLQLVIVRRHLADDVKVADAATDV
jgi:hypothetical protein